MKKLLFIILLLIPIFTKALIINIPDDFPTIQQGINATVDGDTVLVQPGTYFENINYDGKNIIVGSLFLTLQDTTYIPLTIIDGNNSNWRLVSFMSGETEEAKLIGFTIRNGYGYYSSREVAGGVGIYIFNSSPSIENNIIEDNSCYWYINGCGIGIQNSSAKIRNNIIRNNYGAYMGGGIYIYQSDGVMIENNIINNHETQSGYGVAKGAGICANGSTNILIRNNLLYNNVVDYGGAGHGIAFLLSDGTIIGNTIYNNSNTSIGTNLYINSTSNSEMKNCILWSSETYFGSQIATNGFLNVSYSNIKNGFTGTNNIDRNPLFCDPANNDFNLTLQSSCINSGDPTSPYDPDGTIADMGYFYFDMSGYGSLSGLITLELGIGNMDNVTVTTDSFTVILFSDGYYILNLLPGFYDVTARLGLHYEQTINTVQVIQNEVTTGIDFYLENTNTNIVIEIKQDGTGDFTVIQEGINAAINGDTILVHPGVYFENINILEKNIILGSMFLTTGDSTFISETIIDGNNLDSTVKFWDINDTTCVLNGFTIQNGNAIINGGGIYCYYSSPQILNCIITENYSDPHGGGMYCDHSNPVLINNNIYNNNAYHSGGGIACKYSSPVLNNNHINSNSTYIGKGGGIYFYCSSSAIINCTISYNISSSGGGAISFMYSDGYTLINNFLKNNTASFGGGLYFHGQSNGVAINNLIVNNHASYSGGALFSSNSHPDLINNTISNNIADSRGGGLFFTDYNDSNIFNTIIYGNEAEIGEQICLNSSGSDPNFYYSDIEDGFNGFGFTGTASIEDYDGEYENNIMLDPLFIEPETGNFRLLGNSPCINAGTPDTTGLYIPEFDLDGNPRISGDRIDMGCYEFQFVNFDEQLVKVNEAKLFANYPNPFNPTTTIRFTTEDTENTEIIIYNIKGQKVKTLIAFPNPDLSGGTRSVVWDGKDENNKPVSSGVYFYKLKAGEYSKIRKMLLLR
ncbi:MAG: right-handed parallel beta-helix repeat-containing protein [Armatimonadetes bacterium]|nr:right-handed parallel beta-helix repeat-containing protein [Armatimonadota bacterium]